MNVFRTFEPHPDTCGLHTSATLGTFDGVHLGHRGLLEKVVANAHATGTIPAVLTFDKHPLQVVNPSLSPGLLTTLDEKLAAFETLGIEHTYVLSFTGEVAHMTAQAFIKQYLVECLGITYFIVGYDHHFGSDKLKTADHLGTLADEHGFTLEIVPPFTIDGIAVKSSVIRKYLAAGDVEGAQTMLGSPYSITGTVVHGRNIGARLGFPTANIEPFDDGKLIPSNGVYSGWLEHDGTRHEAVITVGPSPTFDLTEELIEVHIPEYQGDLYDAQVRIGFSRRLRGIEKFKSEQALIDQIRQDIELARQHNTHHIYH